MNARIQHKPARRGVDVAASAFSGGPNGSSGSVSNARNSNGSPSRSRPANGSDQSPWGSLWGTLSRTSSFLKQLPRALSISQLSFSQLGYPAYSTSASTETNGGPQHDPDQCAHALDISKEPRPLLGDFLAASDEVEVSYASLLADLSDMAYDVSNVTVDTLWDRHSLQLISSSDTPKQGPMTREAWYAQVKEAHRAAAKSRNQANSTAQQPESQMEALHDHHRPPQISDAAAAVAHALVSGELAQTAPPEPDAEGHITPSVTLVSMDSFEASSPRTSMSSGSHDHVVQIPIITFVRSPPSSPRSSSPALSDLSDPSSRELPSQPASSALAADGDSQPTLLPPPMLTVSAAPVPGEMTSSQAAALTRNDEPPAAWFACDDPVTKIRYFVIQGSTSLEHWQINLQFEPVIFENPALGVRIHRGVYTAALKLYDDLVPLVRQHLATSSFASVTFTGHSLGGSLATVLMLLMVSRGDLPPDCVSPTYTFGAPAVFCGGAGAFSGPTRCEDCGLDCDDAVRAVAAAAAAAVVTPALPPTPSAHCSKRPRGLFAQVGLGEEHIVNVIMHRDIVPRAFACDYMAMADLLVSWIPSFKSLQGLQGPANTPKSLYSFLGRVAVLQPDTTCPFAHALDAVHPHLPSAPGLYRLVAPAPRMRVHALRQSFDLPVPMPASAAVDGGGGILDAAAVMPNMSLLARPLPYTPTPLRFATVEEEEDDTALQASPRMGASARSKSARRQRRRSLTVDPSAANPGDASAPTLRRPSNLKEAVMHFMNNPHPLTTLTEYTAYGPNGSISRYHNPKNYTLGLLSLYGRAPYQQQAKRGSDLGGAAVKALGEVRRVMMNGATTAGLRQGGEQLVPDWPMSPDAQRLIKKQPVETRPPRAHRGQQRLPTARGSPAAASLEHHHRNGPAAPTQEGVSLPRLPALRDVGTFLGY